MPATSVLAAKRAAVYQSEILSMRFRAGINQTGTPRRENEPGVVCSGIDCVHKIVPALGCV